MGERKSLVEGIKAVTADEEKFVFADKPRIAPQAPAEPVLVTPPKGPSTDVISRVPFTTRIRADFADALKRASLERQLQKVAPNTLQEILEEAVEPWLRRHNYLQ